MLLTRPSRFCMQEGLKKFQENDKIKGRLTEVSLYIMLMRSFSGSRPVLTAGAVQGSFGNGEVCNQ